MLNAIGTFERGFGAIPIGLQGVQTILEDVVHFRHAVRDEPIEPLELLIGIGDVALQSGHAGICRVRHFRTPRCQRGQDRGQTLRLKQSFGHVGSDEIVELVHQHRPAFAGRLSLSGAGRAPVVMMDGTGLRGTARSERS